MKKLLTIAILFAFSGVLFAQTDSKDYYKQQIKDRKEMLKYSEKVLKTKISKQAKRSAKDAKKEGWKPFPGASPLEDQMNERELLKTLMNGTLPKYIFGEGSAISTVRQIATKSAETSAIAKIAEGFSVEIMEIINQSLSGIQTGTDAEAMMKTVSESTASVKQKLRFVRPIVQMYRELGDGKVEVQVTMYAESNQAKLALLEKVEEQSKEFSKQLELMLSEKK